MCDQPRESPNHPINMPPTHHTRRRRRRRCPSPSWAATPSRPCQRHYTAHTRCACVCLPCVCVCVWVFIWYVVNPTGHIPHRRKGVSCHCHCHTRLPRPRTKANTHTHMSCDWSECVCGCEDHVQLFHFTLFTISPNDYTLQGTPPPAPPPSTHLVSSPPCLRSSLLSIVLMPPFPRPRLLRKTFI